MREKQLFEPLVIEMDVDTQSVLFNGLELDRRASDEIMSWRLSNGNFVGSFMKS